jgi:hypothetical protein
MVAAFPKFGRENGDMRRISEGKRKMEGTIFSVADTSGLLDVSRVFVSSGLLERASGGQG